MDLTLILGGLVGGWIIGGSAGLSGFGAIAGLALGLLFSRLRQLEARVQQMQRDLDAIRDATRTRTAGDSGFVARKPAPIAPAASSSPPRVHAPEAHDGLFVDALGQPIAAAAGNSVHAAARASTTPVFIDEGESGRERPPTATPASIFPASPPAAPSSIERAWTRLQRWFSEGNVPVKVGMLVLFPGIAALLKYASDQGWLRVPVTVRLIGIALAALAALAFGWRERHRRRGFALALQGGAIGILLMTVFAAFRLYGVLDQGSAFAMAVALVALLGVLAVMQDARVLAVLGLLAGFAAPILITTGHGSHVALFSYYLVLDLGVFAIAWHKRWRELDLLGFLFTFAIGVAWGVLRYEPALRASVQPFLAAFFAIYLAIPVLHAIRANADRSDRRIDGALVFGNPLLAFGLHAALLDGARRPLAVTAIALAIVYGALAAWPRLRRSLLGNAHALLALGFATLSIPLAFSARVTATAFALEGAALVWLGLRQSERWTRRIGLALQALAAVALFLGAGLSAPESAPFANGPYFAALAIALAGWASHALYARADASPALVRGLFGWGLVWWLGANLYEIDRGIEAAHWNAAFLTLAAITAALAACAHARLRTHDAAWTAAFALAAGIVVAVMYGSDGVQPFVGLGLLAFAVYAACGLFALRVLSPPPLEWALAGWWWTWITALAMALRHVAMQAAWGDGWVAALTYAPLLAAWWIGLRRPAWLRAPASDREVGATALLTSFATVAGLLFVGALFVEGRAAPLPFLPLANPLELAMLAALAAAGVWLARQGVPRMAHERRAALLALAALAWVTSATLRAAHHLGGVPWTAAILDSSLAQTALTLVWSVLGVLGWVVGSRRGHRTLWLIGAAVMGLVLAKLLLVDRGHLGNLFGIVSFIAYGLLCTVVGYVAPAPPRKESTA